MSMCFFWIYAISALIMHVSLYKKEILNFKSVLVIMIFRVFFVIVIILANIENDLKYSEFIRIFNFFAFSLSDGLCTKALYNLSNEEITEISEKSNCLYILTFFKQFGTFFGTLLSYSFHRL